MIETYEMLKESLKDYKAPDLKIKRMTDNGEIIRLTKGLYETNINANGYLVANAICSPSYLSFDYALAYYGMIPEAVYTYTSASFNKRKKKIYHNSLGTFLYRDIPEKAYPYELVIKHEGEYAYVIASAEKALCDKLYTVPPIKNKEELKFILFDDLRIDYDMFMNLDFTIFYRLSDLYGSRNVRLLKNWSK